MFGILKNIPQFYGPSKNENFLRIFSNYINKYQKQSEELFNSWFGENSIMVNENLVSYFPARVYNGIDYLAETIMNPANHRSSTVNLSTLLILKPYTFTPILSNQIWLEILACDYLIPCTSHRTRVIIDLTTHCTRQWNSPL